MSSGSVASSTASGSRRGPVSRKASMPTCILCCNAIDNATRFHTVGACGHTGCCSVCALRMRQLMGSISCAMCKTELPRVICVERESDTFESFQDWGDDNIGPTHVFDEASSMFFIKEDYHSHVRKLRDPICKKCGKKFATVQALKTHVLDVHQLQFCGICLEFKKIFLGEHTLFTKEQLKRHNMRGEPKEGFTGHPRCDFCFSRFYSNPELYEHLHKNHFECDICLHSMHIENRYYKNYPDLENHFRADHFLCEEPVCLSKKFVVFKSHIDLQGHMAMEHPHIKTSRKIDVHFKIRRASDDNTDDPYDQYGRNAGYSGASDPNVINVADFPSLSESGGANSGSLFWENHSTARHPRTEDFPALQSSSAGSGARGGRGGPSAFRNALVPPPSLALQAHLDNSNNWEYPELASAAAALGANNPLMRFVKPAKKNKKGKKGGGGGGGGAATTSNARPAPAAAAADEYEEKAAAEEESYEEEEDDYEDKGPSAGAEQSKSAIVLKIGQILGSNAKYEVFREDCKAFREGEADLPAFYAKMRDLFSPEDFEKLFLRLMRLFPDREQVNKFLAYHKQATKAAAKSEGFQDSSSKKNKQKKATPKAAKAAAPTNNKKTPSPSHSGWSSALKDAGLGSASGKSNGRGPAVIVHNTNTRDILGRDDKPKTVWHSSTSWQAPVAAAAPAVGATPVTTKIQTAPIDSFAALSVSTSPTPSASYANSVAGAARPGSAPSGSFKATKSDFPDLPKAGKPVGVQAVTRATWDDHVQSIVHNRTSTQSNGNTGGGSKKKQKKKSMTLAEMAMHFG